MNADDRAFDHRVFEIRIARQDIENSFEHAFLRPSAEPLEHGVPWAEIIRQIAPWRTDPDLPQDRCPYRAADPSGVSIDLLEEQTATSRPPAQQEESQFKKLAQA